MTDYAKHFRARDTRRAYTNKNQHVAFGLLIGVICTLSLCMVWIGATQ